MGFVLNYFLKELAREFFFTRPFKRVIRYIERTTTYQHISIYFSAYWYKLRLLLLFFSYLYEMLKLAIATWYLKFSVRSEAPGHIMVLHYDPNTCKNPEGLASKMARYVAIPFKKLHKVEPIILILRSDQNFEAGSIQGFFRSLSRDQLKTVFEEYVKFREDQKRIEIIGS